MHVLVVAVDDEFGPAAEGEDIVGRDLESFVDEFHRQGLCHCRPVWDVVGINARGSVIMPIGMWGVPPIPSVRFMWLSRLHDRRHFDGRQRLELGNRWDC